MLVRLIWGEQHETPWPSATTQELEISVKCSPSCEATAAYLESSNLLAELSLNRSTQTISLVRYKKMQRNVHQRVTDLASATELAAPSPGKPYDVSSSLTSGPSKSGKSSDV